MYKISCRGFVGFVFVREEKIEQQHKHKLSPEADCPFMIISVEKNTFMLRIGEEDERLSRDRVVEAPSAPEVFPLEVIEPSVQVEEDAEPAREETSPVGDANKTNRETPLSHQAQIINTNEAPAPRTGSVTITVDWQSFPVAIIIILTPADDTQSDYTATI